MQVEPGRPHGRVPRRGSIARRGGGTGAAGVGHARDGRPAGAYAITLWIYAFIIAGGLLQAMGSAMNGQLYKSLANPWLASLVSFGLVVALFGCLSAVFPRPLPTVAAINAMPWWAPLSGVIGAVAVYAGLVLVRRVGAGPYTGLNVTAALVMSIVIDHFGLLRMEVHHCTWPRVVGAILMIGGVVLISAF